MAELNRWAARVDADIAELKSDVSELKSDVSGLKIGVGRLWGDNLEFKLPRKVRPLISQRLGLRRCRIMQSLLVPETIDDLSRPVDEAYEDGRITTAQDARLQDTDLIMRASRTSDGSTVWVAAEASATISAYDIDGARQSADALGTVFVDRAVARVAAYAVGAVDGGRAETASVDGFVVSPDS